MCIRDRLYPFHVQKLQYLQPRDFAARLQFCEWLNENHCVLSRLLFTDEATFTCDGINNTHQWSDENPHATVDTNFQHRFSINVWCGMIDNQLTGPIVLENRLTGQNYLEFLQNEFFPHWKMSHCQNEWTCFSNTTELLVM